MWWLRHSYLLLRGNAQPEHQEDAREAVWSQVLSQTS